jgi:cysteine desulfurase
MRAIYLDNNATTAVDESVLAAMAPTFTGAFGNPSSLHRLGEESADALGAARARVAALIGARTPRSIVFTSGGTESDNLAIHAARARARPRGRDLVLTSTVEHAAVRETLSRGRSDGWRVEEIGVDGQGRLDLDRLLARMDAEQSRLALVALILANNETGVVLPAAQARTVGERAHASGATFHLDAVQAAGKIAIDVEALGVDTLAISAHKLHGPKGAGALYVRPSWESAGFTSQVVGGPQERERRAGTPNVPGIVGFGRACELAREALAGAPAVARLRDRLELGILARVPGARGHARGAPRTPNTASLAFPGLDGEVLLPALSAEGLYVSTGAACSTEKRAPSHVLLAMGLTPAEAVSTLRFSLSRQTTAEEIDEALEIVARTVALLAGAPATTGRN